MTYNFLSDYVEAMKVMMTTSFLLWNMALRIWTCVIVMMRHMIQLIQIMMSIFNTCKTFNNYDFYLIVVFLLFTA